mmetsp:Transcript_94115/g.269478  ORF Transcript_94115/g.269478 Transcript_94115/m.269478 type:complete len:217 (-) Transcript_94115:249-899(-)
MASRRCQRAGSRSKRRSRTPSTTTMQRMTRLSGSTLCTSRSNRSWRSRRSARRRRPPPKRASSRMRARVRVQRAQRRPKTCSSKRSSRTPSRPRNSEVSLYRPGGSRSKWKTMPSTWRGAATSTSTTRRRERLCGNIRRSCTRISWKRSVRRRRRWGPTCRSMPRAAAKKTRGSLRRPSSSMSKTSRISRTNTAKTTSARSGRGSTSQTYSKGMAT